MSNSIHQSAVKQQKEEDTPAGGYSQNLNQIYQNLNNYQAMIENLESGANNQTPQPQQFEVLNQSRY